MSRPLHSNDERSSEPLTKKFPGVLQMVAAAAARRGGGVGGQHGGRHVQWEAHTVGRQHVLGRQHVGEWRGWAGGHAAGLGLRLAAGAGTALSRIITVSILHFKEHTTYCLRLLTATGA